MPFSRFTRIARALVHAAVSPPAPAGAAFVPGADVSLGEDLTAGDLVLEFLVALYGRENGGGTIERSERLLQRLTPGEHGLSAWRPVVLDTSELCALTAPGRCLYVSAGLIGTLADDAPLAFVFAHEIAHHTLGHVASGAVGRWRDWLGEASALPALAVPLINRALFSVEQEYAADREALALCHRAGFELTRCLELFRVLAEWEETGRDLGEKLPGDWLRGSTPFRQWLRERWSGYPALAVRHEAAEVQRIVIESGGGRI